MLLAGELPPSKHKLVVAWIEIHKDDLVADWELAVNGKKPFAINPDYPLDPKLVIPAQAGIQIIEKFPRSGSTSSFCPLRGTLFPLDSRLRGNDGANGLFAIKGLDQ